MPAPLVAALKSGVLGLVLGAAVLAAVAATASASSSGAHSTKVWPVGLIALMAAGAVVLAYKVRAVGVCAGVAMLIICGISVVIGAPRHAGASPLVPAEFFSGVGHIPAVWAVAAATLAAGFIGVSERGSRQSALE